MSFYGKRTLRHSAQSGLNISSQAVDQTTSTMASSVRRDYEKEFGEFFDLCRKQGIPSAEIRVMMRPLLFQAYKRLARKLAFCVTIFCALYVAFSWLQLSSWFPAAIGRLVLIKVLPYWNWTPLYNSKCLVERMGDSVEKPPSPQTGKFETDPANCVLCETLDGVPTVANVSYSVLEENYLERGLPVIYTDSHEPVPLHRFLQLLTTNTGDFLESEPCDVATNLVLRKLFTVKSALHKVRTLHPADKWFLQLRNCQFRAVKSSRHFVTRPDYYPVHLQPFYSSWVLLANNYAGLREEIALFGLVFVQQLHGSFNYRLSPKHPCEWRCPKLRFRLDAGESLVFSTDVWKLDYETGFGDGKTPTAIATILEIDWRS